MKHSWRGPRLPWRPSESALYSKTLTRLVTWGTYIKSLRRDRLLEGAKALPVALGSRWSQVRSIRWSSTPAQAKDALVRLASWWRSLSRRRQYSIAAAGVVLAVAIPFTIFTWTGVTAAQDARQQYRELQAELSHLTPVDLIQVNIYSSLEERFKGAEEASDRARSRLAFLKAFTWVPVLGNRIEEVHLLLDIGFYQGRAGRNLASALGGAVSAPLDDLPPDLAAAQVARALQDGVSKLNQVQEDLRTVAELREKLGTTSLANRYGVLVDRYLPAIQTVAYLSRVSPQAIGHTYALSRELTAIQTLAEDPLDVFANPQETSESLANIEAQAIALEIAFAEVRQATQAFGGEELPELESIRDVLDILGPGITVLRHVTAGTRSLVTLTEAMDTSGFLSQEFGLVAGVALQQAQEELTLARQETSSLQQLLSLQGLDADTFLPPIGFGADSGVSTSSTERVEIMLDEAISATAFLSSFLGYDEPRTYLLIGQNQNEIRATGGFIGVAVQVTLDGGELTELVFHDSTDVDAPPYAENPIPPDGVYWYLWMDRLLFRDANWNPHFPDSAAKVAEIFELAQGVKVDGVITSSKKMAHDLVALFGDITVPEVEGPLTKELSNEYSEGIRIYQCLPRHISARGKRCFDEDLFFALKDRMTSQYPPDLRRSTIELLKDQLDQKNVLVHVFPPVENSLLWEQGWNGAVPVVDHDFLMVVDSSLPGHSNSAVQRSLEYRVSLDPERPMKAEVRLRYDNSELPKNEVCLQFAWEVYHCYWNYFRTYVSPMATDIELPNVPLHEGSLKLIWGYPDADSSSVVLQADVGPARLTELGGYIAVEPGSIITVPINYLLPPEILRSTAPGVFEYRLLLQKQPGMDQDVISMGVQLPPGAKLVATTPEFNSRQGLWLSFDFPLQKDTVIAVTFQMD